MTMPTQNALIGVQLRASHAFDGLSRVHLCAGLARPRPLRHNDRRLTVLAVEILWWMHPALQCSAQLAVAAGDCRRCL